MGHKTVFFGLSLCLCICCIGCSDDILDPTRLGGFSGIPVDNIILDTLGVGEEPQSTYANAEEPFPQDIIPGKQDYVFGAGDVLRISIYELREEGRSFLDEYIVTETGKISIPNVGIIYAAGLTETELEKEIKDILYPAILLNPSVKVSLFRSESQLFSIEGEGVSRSSRYILPRYNFRLLDAIAIAGGIAQFNASYIYVTRQSTGIDVQNLEMAPDAIEFPADAPPKIKNTIKGDGAEDVSEDGLLNLISPSYSMGFTGKSDRVISASEMIADDEKEVLAVIEDVSSKPSEGKSDSGQIEWVFEDGKYVPVSVKGTDQEAKPAEVKPAKKPVATGGDDASSFGWDKIASGGTQSRVIKIPKDKLFGGDPKYNIIIRSGDVIRVPFDVIGEFYILGNVVRRQPINLTGRPMTLVQAISAAGGLGQLAWPSKVEVTRRIARNRQVIVMVDLKKIAAGLQPDFFIKPNDTINVGTHGSARFLASLRNAFFVRTGVGFTYDRNFAYSNRFGQFSGF